MHSGVFTETVTFVRIRYFQHKSGCFTHFKQLKESTFYSYLWQADYAELRIWRADASSTWSLPCSSKTETTNKQLSPQNWALPNNSERQNPPPPIPYTLAPLTKSSTKDISVPELPQHVQHFSLLLFFILIIRRRIFIAFNHWLSSRRREAIRNF